MGTSDVKECKLDHAFANQSWLGLFPQNKLVNGVSDKSDHSPLWLWLNEWKGEPVNMGSSLEMHGWMNLSFSIVSDNWGTSVDGDFLTKVKHCMYVVDEWGKRLRSRYKEEINMCHRNIKEIRAAMGSRDDQLIDCNYSFHQYYLHPKNQHIFLKIFKFLFNSIIISVGYPTATKVLCFLIS